MKVLVERHNHEAEYSHRFKCIRCGSELEFTHSCERKPLTLVIGWISSKKNVRNWRIAHWYLALSRAIEWEICDFSHKQFISSDIIRGCIIPTYWDMRTWRLNVLGVQCPICNKWYYIDKNCSIVPANGDFEREYW